MKHIMDWLLGRRPRQQATPADDERWLEAARPDPAVQELRRRVMLEVERMEHEIADKVRQAQKT